MHGETLKLRKKIQQVYSYIPWT